MNNQKYIFRIRTENAKSRPIPPLCRRAAPPKPPPFPAGSIADARPPKKEPPFRAAHGTGQCPRLLFRGKAQIVPVTVTTVTPGVTDAAPVVSSCVNVAAGTESAVAAPGAGSVSVWPVNV